MEYVLQGRHPSGSRFRLQGREPGTTGSASAPPQGEERLKRRGRDADGVPHPLALQFPPFEECVDRGPANGHIWSNPVSGPPDVWC